MKNNEPETISLPKSFCIFMIAGIQFYVVIKIIVHYYTFFNRGANPDYDYFRGAWKLKEAKPLKTCVVAYKPGV